MKKVLPLLRPADEESILLKPMTRTSSFFLETEDDIVELPSPVEEMSVEAVISRQISPALVDGDLSAQDAFFVADLGEISRQHHQFKSLLPRVEPFYAVKCNPDKRILQRLAYLGANFDCASQAEIQMVLDLGVDPSRIIYANPCKQASHLRYAYEHGVKMMTFDNVDELQKIKQYAPSAQLVIRILTDDSKSICKLGAKFGVSQKTVPVLLETAAALEMNVIGVSFHVGSGCYDAQSYGDAVELASKVFDVAQNYGYKFTLLDIGGGFPGRNASGIKFSAIAEVVRTAIEKLFPVSKNIRIIAEPGRYYASSAFTLVTNVTARRAVHLENDESIYMCKL
jgi:ornithine decarboxylase